MRHMERFAAKTNALVLFGLMMSPSVVHAGAAGPSVGNPGANEAAEDPEPPVARSSVGSRKVAAPAMEGMRPYGAMEAKHVLDDYYNQTNMRIRSAPSVHGRFQLGAKFYQDKLDVSAAVGAVKMASSQAFYQRRPEFVADVYPLRGQYLNVLWYNMLQVPVREADRDPTEFADRDLYERDALRGIDASVYTVGLAPVLKTEWHMAGGKYLIRFGADGFTKMYSKPLFVDETNQSGNKGVGLIEDGEAPVEKRFEDRALRYVHQESLAVGWTPSFAPYASADIGAHIESRYIPQYFRNDSGSWDYLYEPERVSFWRTRLMLDINQSWTLQDEFFVFRNGFFAENRVDQERRFRNVVKVAVKL